MDVRGEAPFAVHVHGLQSTLGAGDITTARFEWTFGDPGGGYTTLLGWNAAHVYDQPGTYLVTLRITNQQREIATTSLQVTVDAPVRRGIYASPWGNDSADGASSANPVRSLERVQSLLGDDTAVFLQRGTVFEGASGLTIAGRNVYLGAYGSGAAPVIRYTSPTPYARIVRVDDSAEGVVIEGLHLDSPFTPTKSIVRGIECHGRNVVIRDCHFGNISDAINTGGGDAVGLLTQDNHCGVIGGYFAWIEGTDHTHLGNIVGGSVEEHNFRLGGASRVSFAHNDLTNHAKTNIWCMLGDHVSASRNTFRHGRLVAGPNFSVVYPTDRLEALAADDNTFVDATFTAYDGASRLALRNNIFLADARDAISIWGHSAERGRTVSDVIVAHNTIINRSDEYGRALTVGDGAQRVTVMGNLHAADALNGHNGGNVVCDASSLSTHIFHANVWAVPDVGPRCHEIDGWLMDADDWNAQSQTTSEVHRAFAAGDIDGSHRPLFNATVFAAAPGVFTDRLGHPRPSSGPVTAGALELLSGAQPAEGGDVDGDGSVNIDDLLAVTSAWGMCLACPADLTADGWVNIDDLLVVIAGWDQ